MRYIKLAVSIQYQLPASVAPVLVLAHLPGWLLSTADNVHVAQMLGPMTDDRQDDRSPVTSHWPSDCVTWTRAALPCGANPTSKQVA